MSALIVQSGPEAGRRLEVEGEHTIGREDQEFTLSDPEVSRRHAVVRATAAGIEIEDLGSSNGTFVNGDRIAGATELGDGDEVRVGQTTLSVEAPRTQATKISAGPPVDPGATVIRSSGEVAPPAGAGEAVGSAEPPAQAPSPSDYVAPQPAAEQPAPDGPPQEPAPPEPEQPGYQPPGHDEPIPTVPGPGDYQPPQPAPEAGASGPQPDLVTESGSPTGYPPRDPSAPGTWEGGEQAFPPTDQQPAYGGPPGQDQGGYGGQQAYGGQPEQGAYGPPGQTGWQSGQQQGYGAPGGYGAGQATNKTWLWIAIAVVVVAAIAAALYFLVL